MNKLMGRAFVLLWISETVFDMGAALMGFALGVWIFESTGSTEQFAYSLLAAAIPAMLVSPFAGAFADHFDRRWVIASCDTMVAFMVAAVAVLLFNKMLVVEHMYVFNALAGVIGAVRDPSYMAAVTQIVPKDSLTRARGLIGLTQGLQQIGAPLAAGYLMAMIGFEGIMVVEVIAVVAGAMTMFAALSHARHAIRGTGSDEVLPMLEGVKASLSGVIEYFKAHRLMISLAVYILIQEGLLVLASGMLTPMVLSTHSSDVLGLVMTLGAVGALVGSLLLTVSNVKTHLMLLVLVADVGLAGSVMLAGLGASTMGWAACAFTAFACGSVSEGCAGALWMRKVPKEKQGSVFAIVAALNLLVMCVVMLMGSKLVEQVFEPAMVADGVWAQSIGAWVGTGKGRGIALLYIVSGAIGTLVSLLAIAHPRLRRLDDLVPDQGASENLNVVAPTITAGPGTEGADDVELVSSTMSPRL